MVATGREDRGLICVSPGVNGSTGDVRPLIALALALRARGFEIVFVGDVAFERFAMHAGIAASEWFSCSEIPQTVWLRTEGGQRRLWGDRLRRRDRWMPRELRAHWLERIERLWQRLGGPDNPRIVAAVGSITAYRILQRFGSTCAKVISCAMPYQPSRTFTMDPPDLSFHQRVRQRVRAWMRRRAAADEQRVFCEETFHLVYASPSIFPRPEDWLPNMQVTGFLPFPEDARDWSPPDSLLAFLRDGPPPVYVGFGAHAVLRGPEGERRARAIVDGCRQRDVRCILQCADLPRSWGSDQILMLDGDVPHAWLFPRCGAIIHHGGYGTMHAALVARRPMVIYPFQTDQFLWAKRMGELGAGPGFTGRLRDLSASRLAADLAFVLEPACRQRADELGAALMRDDGLTTQVVAIESIIAHTRRGLPPIAWRMPAIGNEAGEATPLLEHPSAVHY